MVQVKLALGEVKGSQREGHQAFLGMPFAGAPSGSFRWLPPQPVQAWQGVKDATCFGFSCPQGQHPIPGMAASGPRDEDCLCLNVYTPAADDGKRPVLFWIHGGGFRLGSGSEALYDGGPLAVRGDVVVVSIHYRLAALGYACFGAESRAWGASANCGQLDQIEALRWVRAHIDRFGGDPGNVTIFGESAGSAAVSTLLAMPAAKGLFHKAIMQSGVGKAQSFEEASEFGLKLLGSLGVDAADHDAIAALDADAIVERAIELSTDMFTGTLSPVIDGDTLPMSAAKANREGASAEIPLLIGTNRDEMKLFNFSVNRPRLSDAELLAAVAGEGLAEPAAAVLIERFREARTAEALPADNEDVLDLIQTVMRFREPSIRFAADHAAHQPDTYLYLFTRESPARRGAFGACHALEMPFVFGTLNAPTQDKFAGTGPDVEQLSRNMMDAWIAFARTGNPGHDGIGAWAPFDADSHATLIFDADCCMMNDPLAAERIAVQAARQTGVSP